MTTWQLAKRRGKNGNANAKVAAELLRSLLSGSSAPKKPEWKCPACGVFNFMDRHCCRKCAGGRKSDKKPITTAPSQRAGPAPAARAKLAPWAKTEAASKRAVAYTAALEAVQAVGGCEELEQAWSERLKEEEKQATTTSSVLERLDNTKGFITRAEKRLLSLKEAAAAACNAVDEAEEELDAARRRATVLEEEARVELKAAPAPAPQADGLEDAIRTLMVCLHSLQLPAQVCTAATAVVNLLPQHAPSADAEETGVLISENAVAAGRLDEPLSIVNAVGDEDFDFDLEPADDESVAVYAARVKKVVSKSRKSGGLGIHDNIGKTKTK